jgi:arsenate reductase
MRKQKVLFLCTQNSARSQMAEGFLRHLAGDRFEVYSAGIDPTAEIHPCAIEAMREVGIDISEQYPKGLRTYMGKMGFNYLIIVCARAEERCPKTFPGVGTTFSWIFEDPRREEDIPYDSMLERFRKVRDEIELKIRGWLEHPEEDLRKLREERERGSKESPFGRILWPVRRGERPSAIFQTVVSPVTWVNKAISGNALKEAI